MEVQDRSYSRVAQELLEETAGVDVTTTTAAATGGDGCAAEAPELEGTLTAELAEADEVGSPGFECQKGFQCAGC